MSRIWNSFRRFRGNRPVNIVASSVFLLFDLYNVIIETGVVSLVLDLVFLVVGLLGLYKRFLGDIAETVKNQF